MAARAGRPIYIDGPWSHRSVSANGTRFHIAESGDGPLVLLLHGFPQFWWTWREQLSSLQPPAIRAVAADLRGYGGSDKPPRGYDLITAASDAAGLIRSLGEANAVVVGHDWGGLIAWTMAAYLPKVVRRLAVVSVAASAAAAGRRARRPVRPGPQQRLRRSASSSPCCPNGSCSAHDAKRVGQMLTPGPGPAGPTRRSERRTAPRCASPRSRTPRWSITAGSCGPGCGRTACATRADARAGPGAHPAAARLARQLRAGGTARGSGRYVDAPYRWRLIDGAGHFPHEELSRPLRPRAVLLAGRPRTRTVTGRQPRPAGGPGRPAGPAAGRPRNARPRDAGLGRPLDRGSGRGADHPR